MEIIIKTNQFDKIFEKKCDVCGKTLLASKTGNGECQHCGWMLEPKGLLRNLTPFGGWINEN